MHRKTLLVALLLGAACAWALAPRPYARQLDETITEIESMPNSRGWLHVEVETSYSWFHQKSKGRAWVTVGKNDTTPAQVGRICIRLEAHDAAQRCERNTDDITIEEKKRGVQIRKRTAIVTAWTEEPALDTLTVRMDP